ncbi:hypothetical protein [Methylobacterium iners]|uniref:Uncharacterized protein n=1 Tax=Methylobacterium iners TaxID=418707 RepID=A0ABQ4RRX2_9HYPH|nr:hypothetical protein [Methylobacterium iners]GJD92908.1 hypothetical protein OCOJLMKI_0091 [Methylobacterium iners]
MTDEPVCSVCSRLTRLSCEQPNCPTRVRAVNLALVSAVTPIAALKRQALEVDRAVFDEGRLPKVAEWSGILEMILKLDERPSATEDGAEYSDEELELARLPAPAMKPAGNVVPFRRR